MEVEKYYLINSKLTGRPYIDKDRKAYVYIDNFEMAKEFSDSVQDTEVSSPMVNGEKLDAQGVIINQCLRVGVKTLVKRKCDGSESETVLYTPILPKEWLNGALNSQIDILKHTKSMENLLAMRDGTFLVAIKITNSPTVGLNFAIAKNSDPKITYSMLLAFSTVGEFLQWKLAVPDQSWEPLMLSFEKLLRVVNEDGVILNPSGNRLILTPQMLKIVSEKGGKSG